MWFKTDEKATVYNGVRLTKIKPDELLGVVRLAWIRLTLVSLTMAERKKPVQTNGPKREHCGERFLIFVKN